MRASNLLAIFLFSLSTLVIDSPAAQANHDQINGCGSDPYARAVRDEVFANFTEACNNHDRCYGTLGRGKTDCDNQFLDEMNQRCASTYDDWYEYVSLQPCYASAGLYYEAVVAFGSSAYNEAQSHARQASQSTSSAGWNMCNRSNAEQVFVAYSYHDGQTWVRSGWRTIARGQCSTLISDISTRYVYYYAEGSDGRRWTGNRSYCVHPNERFSLRPTQNCSAPYELRPFREVDTGEYRNWTTTLTE